MSQFKKLTNEQRAVKRWRAERNALVARILSGDPRILREDALRLANQRMPPMPGEAPVKPDRLPFNPHRAELDELLRLGCITAGQHSYAVRRPGELTILNKGRENRERLSAPASKPRAVEPLRPNAKALPADSTGALMAFRKRK